MVKSVMLVCLSLIYNIALGQNLNSYSTQEISSCDTAKDIKALSNEEKKVILLVNLARMDGIKFAASIVEPYLKGQQKTPYTKSLIKDLKKIKNLPLLKFNAQLQQIASEHARNMGKSGKVGHQDFAKRIASVKNSFYGVFENCDYGYNDALKIVMRLLIDENITNLGHRKALLNEEAHFIGTSIQPHKKWDHNCVQILAGKRL